MPVRMSTPYVVGTGGQSSPPSRGLAASAARRTGKGRGDSSRLSVPCPVLAGRTATDRRSDSTSWDPGGRRIQSPSEQTGRRAQLRRGASLAGSEAWGVELPPGGPLVLAIDIKPRVWRRTWHSAWSQHRAPRAQQSPGTRARPLVVAWETNRNGDADDIGRCSRAGHEDGCLCMWGAGSCGALRARAST